MAWDTKPIEHKEYKLFKILKERGLIDYARHEQISLTQEGRDIARQIAKELGPVKVALLFIFIMVVWYEHLEEMYLLWGDTTKLINVIKRVLKD